MKRSARTCGAIDFHLKYRWLFGGVSAHDLDGVFDNNNNDCWGEEQPASGGGLGRAESWQMLHTFQTR